MASKLQRPDMKQLNKRRETVSNIVSQLMEMLLSCDGNSYTENIKLSANKFLQNIEKEILMNTDGDVLIYQAKGPAINKPDTICKMSVWEILNSKGKNVTANDRFAAELFQKSVVSKITIAMLTKTAMTDAMPVCNAIYRYYHIEALKPQLGGLYGTVSLILDEINQIEIPKTKMAWITSSRNSKEAVIATDQLLQQLVEGQLPQIFTVLSKQFEAANKPDPEIAYDDYLRNLSRNQKLLEGLGFTYGKSDPFPVNEIEYAEQASETEVSRKMPTLQGYNAALEKINKIRPQLQYVMKQDDTSAKAIDTAAEKALEASAMGFAKQTDIDVLKKYGQRLKIDALRRHGYNRLSDLINVSGWRLQQIEGIGEITAEKTVSAVRMAYADIKVNARVRPLLQYRFQVCKDLLRACYVYIHRRDIQKKCKPYADQMESLYLSASNMVIPRSKYSWYFIPEQVRSSKWQTYQRAKELAIKSEDIQRLINQFTRVATEHDDIIWADYQKNMRAYNALFTEHSIY